jgi:hypothetical protein
LAFFRIFLCKWEIDSERDIQGRKRERERGGEGERDSKRETQVRKREREREIVKEEKEGRKR